MIANGFPVAKAETLRENNATNRALVGERPVKQEKCTDCCCIPLYIVAWVCMITIAIVALVEGDARRLIFATDYLGNTCGICQENGEGCGASIYYPRPGMDAVLQGYDPDNPPNVFSAVFGLYGICVSSCPDLGSYICNYEVERNLSAAVSSDEERHSILQSCAQAMNAKSRGALNNYGLNALSEPCHTYMKGCWYVAQKMSNLFFRCVGTEVLNETSAYTCFSPAYQDEARTLRMPARVCSDVASDDILPTSECNATACAARGNSCVSNDRCIYELEETLTYSVVDPRAGGLNIIASQLGTWALTIWRNLGDVRETWWTILIVGIIGAFCIGLVWLRILEKWVGFFVWLMIFLSFAGLTVVLLICFAKAGKLTNSVTALNEATDENIVLASLLSTSDSQTNIWNALGVILAIIECICFLMLLVMWSKVLLAIKVLGEAARAIRTIKSVLIVPAFTSLAVFLLGIYTIGIGGYLVTAGNLELTDLTISGVADSIASSVNQSTTNLTRRSLHHAYESPVDSADIVRQLLSVDNITTAVDITIQKLVSTPGLPGMLLVHIYGSIWSFYIISGVGFMTISIAISRWYWSGGASAFHDESSLEGEPGSQYSTSSLDHPPSSNLYSAPRAFWHVARYHMGSIYFGSLLIATVQMLRLILWYISKQTQKIQKENRIVRYVMLALKRCLAYCKWLLEEVTTNAYVIVGMQGCGFKTAAKLAVETLTVNLSRVAVVGLVNMLISLLSTLVIVTTCVILEFLWLDRSSAFSSTGKHSINSPVISILLTALASAWVANGFMQVYEVTVQTILLCFCKDIKMNRATKAYAMSSNMREIMARPSRKKRKSKKNKLAEKQEPPKVTAVLPT